MMRILALLIIVCSFQHINAADIKYPVSQIPKQLLKGANVVCRTQVEEYHLVSLDEAIVKTRVALTILNEKGDRFSGMVVHYSNLIKVTGFEGSLYNAEGQLIRKLKSKEIGDQSNVSEISLMDDSRVKFHNFNHRTYPYTVEYEVEEKYLNTYNFPRWFPQAAEHYAVEHSSFRFVAPLDYKVRYKAFNYPQPPAETIQGKYKSYFWEIRDQAVIQSVFASPQWREMTTNVFFAPSDFKMQGYTGNASSWEEFGKFQVKLHDGKDRLPQNILDKIQQLTAGISDEKEKVKILFEFLQQNTRYILISFGIGSLQPFEASYVASKGYGDCKALSNYMYSILKAAGIKSHYALINGGRESYARFFVEEFPSHQFNHMVLSVPLAKDTMWLECTSQTESAGYMGSYTGNRKALLITDQGGKLVNTPRYGLKENLQTRAIDAKIDAEGNLVMDVSTIYKGTQQDEVSSLINNNSKDKVQKILQQHLELPTYEINSFKYDLKKGMLPQIEEDLNITVPAYATVSGKRMFIVPNILNRGGLRLTFDTTRKLDYVFESEYRDEDKQVIEIPAGYELETPFENIAIKTPFGNYSATLKVEGNKIIYHRIREQFSGRFPPASGEAIAKYYNDIYKSDRLRIVFVKSQK
jgi:hypothetical protein